MRKWYFPMTVLGVGGLGVLLFTERGRKVMQWAIENAPRAHSQFLEWNEAAQHELDRIQNALNRVAESLGAIEPAR